MIGVGYQRLRETNAGQRHLAHVTDRQIELARLGHNERCVDCWGEPLANGLRCTRCFRRVARPKRTNGCGTTAGYRQHRRLGEVPCDPCRQANARYVNSLRSIA